MASTNQSPFYKKAEEKFLSSQSDEERLVHLEEMIRECPKHKSSEKMLAQLRTRHKKLQKKMERGKKSGKSSKKGIKKEEMQAAIVGFTNVGKSSLLSFLTNAKPEITPYSFTTKNSIIGMMPFQGTKIQLVEVPSIGSEFYDKGIVNTADTLLILVTNLEQIKKIGDELEKAKGKKIVLFNLKENLDERKIRATLQSKKYDFVIINLNKKDDLEELKEKLFKSFGKIRIFTKEPGKQVNKNNPIVLDIGENVKTVAEKILHGFSKQVKESFVTGPSSKFPNQKVSLSHELKDLDVVEFRTR
ncbi:MAG TPA: TGS domain-containing protein [Candidatus Pacearchaeota archaeon]|nr:TGS domain-containing protein [Candidatus Pacearchaeota archaeon]